jgi:hypothetical protein
VSTERDDARTSSLTAITSWSERGLLIDTNEYGKALRPSTVGKNCYGLSGVADNAQFGHARQAGGEK